MGAIMWQLGQLRRARNEPREEETCLRKDKTRMIRKASRTWQDQSLEESLMSELMMKREELCSYR
jgi:hypothetical protein